MSGSRGVEIPCQTCPTWSHFFQDKLEILFTCPWTKCLDPGVWNLPCLTCQTWSHFILNKLENPFTCPGTNLKKVTTILFSYSIIIMHYMNMNNNCVVLKTVWLQEEAS